MFVDPVELVLKSTRTNVQNRPNCLISLFKDSHGPGRSRPIPTGYDDDDELLNDFQFFSLKRLKSQDTRHITLHIVDVVIDSFSSYITSTTIGLTIII